MDTAPTPSGDPPPSQPSPPVQPVVAEHDAASWAMWCHLSALSGLFVPFGQVLGPLIVWQLKKDYVPSISAHGREAVNFHLSVILYLTGAVILMFFALCLGFLIIPILIAIGIGSLVLSIVAAVQASSGRFYRYPLNLRLIR